MKNTPFHHALTIDKNICIGCTHCLKVCPTQAIRVLDGKAGLFENRCIDCGECLRSCPVSAIKVKDDDFAKIYDFKYRVLLIPSVLIGQFSEELDEPVIHDLLKQIGFHEIFEIDLTVDIAKDMYQQYFKQHAENKPLISSFCPAVVRLIQVKFPSLTENLVLVKAPLDIAAAYKRKDLIEKGIPENDIGIFYATPCAAKIAAVKSPVGEEKSEINGVINLNVIYNKICRGLVNLKKPKTNIHPQLLHKSALQWSLTGGETANFDGRCLAIDEIHNVINFLEKIENENPQLAASIRDLMFVFDDILLIDDTGISEILKRADKKTLTIALKGTSEELRNQFFRNMSSRAVEMMKEEMEFMGPVKLKDVEKAQHEIVEIVRQLEEEGVISIGGGGGDDYVS